MVAGDESAPRASCGRPLRIALVSTPRSGNTWLRHLLARTYGLHDRAVHDLAELDWSAPPDRCLLQVHRHRDGPFLDLLGRHGFRVVTITRHPLDVLVSILHFAPREPETARWLAGEGGTEAGLAGASPLSPAFLEYAAGPRAAALLGIGVAWSTAPATHRLRYEDLVGDPVGVLGRFGKAIGCPTPPDRVAEAVAATSMQALRLTSRNGHFWQGRPGLWRQFLPAAEARRIERAHRAVFRALGYDCDPDETLDAARAEANWLLAC